MGMPNQEPGSPKTEIRDLFESIDMTTRKLNWYEFFAGGGMARLGLGMHWNCIFANEWSPRKARAYRAYFGPSPELRLDDVRTLTVGDLPGRADLVWASFPCQDLSLAGAGAGLSGERSGTFVPFWQLIDGLIAKKRRPRLVVLENVPGAITSHNGRDFATLIRTISSSGYAVGALVVDAVHFVPQSRPRLFIIATGLNEKIPAELTLREHNTLWHPRSMVKAYYEWPQSLKEKWIWWDLPAPRKQPTVGLSSVIERDPTGVAWHTQQETKRLVNLMSETNKKKVRLAQSEEALRIGTVYKRTRPLSSAPGAKRVQRAEVRFDDISGCLRTPVGGSSRQTILLAQGERLRSRLLSPREAARLMGVPEDYPLPEKYNDAYHLFGDGLVVPVVSWLEKYLLRPLAGTKALERVA